MDVKVTASGGSSGPIDWEIDGKKAKDSSIFFEKGSGPHTVKFKLDDKTGRDLRFDDGSPFWAHINEAGECPPKDATNSQTGVVKCTDKELTVSNANSGNPCTIRSQLNFVDGAGNPQSVDPDFKNGGTGNA